MIFECKRHGKVFDNNEDYQKHIYEEHVIPQEKLLYKINQIKRFYNKL